MLYRGAAEYMSKRVLGKNIPELSDVGIQWKQCALCTDSSQGILISNVYNKQTIV